jgi:signal transduction histidine kinase
METTVSDVRRRARYYALHGSSKTEMAERVARTRRFMVLFFQLAVLGFLAERGYPHGRLLVHGAVCLFYLAFCRHPTGPITYRAKMRMLGAGLFAYLVWIVNTGALASPLLPLGLSMLAPVSLYLDTSRQKRSFLGGSLVLLAALALLSLTRAGALVPPLVLANGQVSLDYLLIAVGAIVVTGALVSSFWYKLAASYDQVALELGTRREELCSESEDRTRELEGAAAHLAHEMKNPLASIKCLSAHMARGSLDPKTAERLGVVAAEADRLEAIVDGFLSLSRGLAELRLEPTRPFEIACELKLLLDVRVKEAGLALEVTGDGGSEIQADFKKLHRALFHLVVNAMQASAPGQTVTVDVGRPADGKMVIKVIDRGQGMSAHVLQRVGRPHFSTREGGTGLGVAVARTLVEQHGGRLEYQSVPGSGTTALIELPVRPPPCGTRLPLSGGPPLPARPEGR